MNILVTGSAGFIGFSVSQELLKKGNNVIGIDNHNNYYDPKLKEERYKILNNFSNYKHYRTDLFDNNNRYILLFLSYM